MPFVAGFKEYSVNRALKVKLDEPLGILRSGPKMRVKAEQGELIQIRVVQRGKGAQVSS